MHVFAGKPRGVCSLIIAFSATTKTLTLLPSVHGLLLTSGETVQYATRHTPNWLLPTPIRILRVVRALSATTSYSHQRNKYKRRRARGRNALPRRLQFLVGGHIALADQNDPQARRVRVHKRCVIYNARIRVPPQPSPTIKKQFFYLFFFRTRREYKTMIK